MGRSETSSLSVYAGDEVSVPSVVHAPPPTRRWKVTDWVARSGSTAASRCTGSIAVTVGPAGEEIRTDGDGTRAERAEVPRVWPALSSTAARYSTDVPGRRVLTSSKTRYGAESSVPIERHPPCPTRRWKVTS